MKYKNIGLKTPEVLLPGKDYETWAVVACDQYTSQKEVWEQMERQVADKPSTLKLMLPEVYLEESDVERRRQDINRTMNEYLEKGIFEQSVNSMILVERQTTSGTRLGLVAAVDLDEYDYTPQSRALIRSTEQTIADRLPPRVKIRMDAAIEMPHIMLLIDDGGHTVLKPAAETVDDADKLYDFDLMTDGGHIRGYKVSPDTEAKIAESLSRLKDKNDGFLYAMGDGNHSLATAKECWEIKKKEKDVNEKAKYALVEIVNLHDDSLVFEPIHRVLYNCGKDAHKNFKKILASIADIKGKNIVEVECVCEGKTLEFKIPSDRLSVAYIEEAVEIFLSQNPEAKVDYVHGDDVARGLGEMEGTFSIILPPFDKNLLFKTVADCGQLPRKSFSMGHAQDKRYYLECRKIK